MTFAPASGRGRRQSEPAEPSAPAEVVRKPGIGDQIRQLRRAKGWTLQDLAGRIGMSIGYVSQVERDRSVLTVASLMRISDAFGVPLNFFFQPTEPVPGSERGIVVRARHRRRMTFPGLGVTDELLSPDLNGPLEVLMSTIEAGADSGEPYRHDGVEAGVVIEGVLDLWVGKRHFRLEAGDSFTFRSKEPHRCGNPGKTPTRVVWIITPPSY